MKKVIVLSFALALCLSVFGQKSNPYKLEKRFRYLDSTFVKLIRTPGLSSPFKTYAEGMSKQFSRATNWSSLKPVDRKQITQSMKSISSKFETIVLEGSSGVNTDCIKACMDQYPLGTEDAYLNRQRCYANCK